MTLMLTNRENYNLTAELHIAKISEISWSFFRIVSRMNWVVFIVRNSKTPMTMYLYTKVLMTFTRTVQ